MKDRGSDELDPETSQMLKAQQQQLVNKAIEELPIEFREVIILRELEELSYKEIAAVAGIPIGTVMSRLARGRKRLQVALSGAQPGEWLVALRAPRLSDESKRRFL